MTNPLGPRPNDDSLEKQPPEKEKEASSGLSYGELMSLEKDREKAAQAEGEKQAKAEMPLRFTKDTTGIAKGAFGYMGPRPPFQLRKSEFLHELEKTAQEVKPLVDKFLKETPHRDDPSLTPAERQELTQTRDSLSRFTSPTDALNQALHLARLYQHLRYIEEAKKATDLSLGIDPENRLGKELFKELERMHPPDVAPAVRRVVAYEPLTKSNLRKRIIELAGGRVIVVGDLLIDELLEGKPERISREAPVLILEHVDTELILGGAANTAHNIASLGGKCHAIGVCGKDEYAAKLAGLLESAGISHALVEDPYRPTTVKTRILSKAHSLRQQLIRLDRISHEPVSALVETMLAERLKQAAGSYNAVVISDYRGGTITDGLVAACRSLAQGRQLTVVVDAQDRLERFQEATLMTPNQPDTEKMVGFAITDRDSLKKAGNELLLLTGAKAILITRGAEGMALFQQGAELVELPAFNKSDVFDVTGAGDTVAATMALALVTGSTFVEAMALGNLAAGIVVRKPGTAVTNQREMLEQLEQANLPE